MPNVASVLKAEIARVARKEVRAEVDSLRKANAQQRSAMAALRRQLEALQKEVRRIGSPRSPAVKANDEQQAATGEAAQRRFSAARLAAHRAKLGVSAVTYGKLLGIGGQTIYNWEQGKTRPNPRQIEQLAQTRALSRQALLERLGVSAES